MTLLIYSLIAGAILSLLWGAFKLSGLGQTTHFGLNRAVLVVTLLLSSVLPFVAFRPIDEVAEVRQVGHVEFVEHIEFVEFVESAEPAFDWAPVRSAAVTLYLIGASACALWMLLGFTGVVIAIASGRREGNNLIVHRRNISPFAWGRWIVISERDCANQTILRHESAHLRAAHWLDLLLSRVVTCLLWYWPTAWLLNRDLCQAHEFEADRAVLNSGVAPAEYQLMLVGAGSGRLFSNIVNPFNFYSLKYRIAMMKMKKSPAGSRMRVLAMLPAAAVAALLASAPALALTVSNYMPKEEVKVTELKIVDDDAIETQSNNDDPQEIFYTAEKMPQFPGGEMEMYKWLSMYIKYPEEAAKKDIQGRVMVQFVVEKDGSIGPVKVVRGVDPLLDAEAVRVVKTLPKFTPGTMNGEPVRVWYAMPLMFKLQGDDKPTKAVEENAKASTVPKGKILDEVVIVGY